MSAWYIHGMELNSDASCFVCGSANERGLGLTFALEADPARASADWVFPAWCQGWAGVVHGGLLASVLDELCIKSAEALGLPCVTATLDVKYRRPVLTEQACRGEGTLLSRRGRVLEATSRIMNGDGVVCASAQARLMLIPREEPPKKEEENG